jgi:hypothetical protein
MKHILLYFSVCLLLCVVGLPLAAQSPDWMQMHTTYGGHAFSFPYAREHFSRFTFDDTQHVLRGHIAGAEERVVPFAVNGGETTEAESIALDSMTLSSTLADWGRHKHRVFAININTTDARPVDSKDTYVPCYISFDGRGEYPDLSLTGRIRGRGNSTWLWYDKKPYRIKFDASNKVFGIDKNKDWVLLANYRDVTKVMNTFCFIAADWMGMHFTTPVRYAEVFLNGDYIGLYQIAEQVEVGGNRVDIDEASGLLLSLDLDDGPDLSPGTGDNFWSEVYRMPVCVKYPEDIDADRLAQIRTEFGKLEAAVQAHDYALCDSLMDLHSFIAMLQLQEYVFNVELSAPRSVFLFRDGNGRWGWGPAWDWDAGFDFRWSDMTTGHTFFDSYTKTVIGNNPPLRGMGVAFFTDLFKSGDFTKRYKERWAEISDSLYTKTWTETQRYLDEMEQGEAVVGTGGMGYSTSALLRETDRWPLVGFDHTAEVSKMKRWLRNRLTYLNGIIASYTVLDDNGESPTPLPGDNVEVVGTLRKNVTLQQSKGYAQSVNISVSPDELATALGVSASSLTPSRMTLLPLNADGSLGQNTAAGTYGAWFDADGNTVVFGTNQCVYIETDALFSWNCGLEQGNVVGGETYTVTMQYRYAVDTTTTRGVNVRVAFTIEGSGGGWGW